MGQRLRALRESRGLSQVVVASALRVAQNTISRIETSGTVSLDTLVLMARFYGVSIDYLILGEKPSEAA